MNIVPSTPDVQPPPASPAHSPNPQSGTLSRPSRRSRIYAAHGLLPARNLRKHLTLSALPADQLDVHLHAIADQRRAEYIADLEREAAK